MKFCGGCGAAQVPGDQFCARCGRPYSADASPQAVTSLAAPSPRWGGATDDEPFPEWAPIAAGAGVVFVPFISLIAALVMRSTETRPSRRAFLKTWAIASGAWLCTGFVIFIIIFAAIASSVSSLGGVVNGKCKNGADTLTPPSYTSPDGTHWTAVVSCIGGGTISRPATKSEERFLNGH